MEHGVGWCHNRPGGEAGGGVRRCRDRSKGSALRRVELVDLVEEHCPEVRLRAEVVDVGVPVEHSELLLSARTGVAYTPFPADYNRNSEQQQGENILVFQKTSFGVLFQNVPDYFQNLF